MAQDNICTVCKKRASQSCSACNEVYYCSKEHQKQDWKYHKNACAPYKILTSDALGRYLVATRDINIGETIMKKNPLIVGPKMVSFPLCLGCHKRLHVNTKRYDCSKCKWPLCGKPCETTAWHQLECSILTKNNFKPFISSEGGKQSIYSCITPLRALLLKTKDQGKFETLLKCQSHLDQHRTTPVYQVLKNNLVPLFCNVLKLQTSEDEILKVCSIFDTNSFEVRDPRGLVNIRGLYPTVSLLSHDCKPNTKHSFHGDIHQLVLTATVSIKKGDLITVTYTQTLWNTLSRRAHLRQSKLFNCTCARCKDPTEFGTYCGAINCSNCTCGSEMSKVVSNNPLDQDSNWSCQKCGHLIQARQIIWGNDTLRKEIASMDKTNPESLESFLSKYAEVLHGTNTHFLEVKYALTQMYGNMPGYQLEEMPVQLLDRKIELCRELLKVADVLEPGYSRFRGSLMYDLQAALVTKVKVDFAENKITKEEAEGVLDESVQYLQEASKILQSEPDMKEVLEGRLKDLQKLLGL